MSIRKMRAWETKQKVWHYFELPYAIGQSVPGMTENKLWYENWCDYSGFKDKAGDEIYEGDKCAVNMATGGIVNAFVVFVDGCFELQFVSPVVIYSSFRKAFYNDRDYLKCWICNHAVEIIGNRFETPELLS